MKISKTKLRQIIKEELGTLSEDSETDQLAVNLLRQIVEDINSAYNKVGTSQELFADLLKQNVDLYLQRWEEEREPVEDEEETIRDEPEDPFAKIQDQPFGGIGPVDKDVKDYAHPYSVLKNKKSK